MDYAYFNFIKMVGLKYFFEQNYQLFLSYSKDHFKKIARNYDNESHDVVFYLMNRRGV
jgi:hypothetical protein